MSDKIILEKVNESFYRVHCENNGIHKELYSYFSFKVPNAHFSPKYKLGLWNGCVSLYTNMMLPSGLLLRFKKFIDFNNYECKYPEEVIPIIPREEIKEITDKLFEKWEHDLREDQLDAIYKAFKYKKGILQSATGTGKSALIFGISTFRSLSDESKTLIIVPNVALVEQLYVDFKNYGLDVYTFVDKIYSGQIQGNKLITISTWQSLLNRSPDYFTQFNTVICDETHLASGNSISKVLKLCVNADMRIGLTGTMPTELPDFYSVCSFLGSVIYQHSTRDAIEKGILSDLSIVKLMLKYSPEMIDLMYNRSYENEISILEEYKPRRKALNFIFDKGVLPGDNTIILVKHNKDLESIYEYLVKRYPEKKIFKYFGATKVKEKEDIRNSLEDLEDAIIVSNFQSMSTGINIKKIHNIVFFSSYKSSIKIIQSIGRSLRLHASKVSAIIWDCVDDLTLKTKSSEKKNHSLKHSEIRDEYYALEKHRVIYKNIIL